MSERVCEHCGADLTGHRKHARFCSGACRAGAWRREHEKPHRTLSDKPRAPSRNGRGVRPYLLPEDFTDGRINGSGLRKVTEARRRLEAL